MQNFSIVDYCSDRINNIKAFNEYISNNQTSSDNSRSKKRRTTSFRRYCIPRKHRLVPSAKVPKDRKVGLLRCRKHRRRSMLKEKDTISYVRLEINVWHAKRFKMATKWGWRLPMHSYGSGLQSLWKRAETSAVACDLSFHRTLEILCIEPDGLVPFLSNFVAPNSSLKEIFLLQNHILEIFNADTIDLCENNFILREIETLFYDSRSSSRRLLGPVTVTLIPHLVSTSTSPNQIKIWLRIHPSICDAVIGCLQAVLDNNSSGAFRNKIIFHGHQSLVPINRFSLLGHAATDILRRVAVVSSTNTPIPSSATYSTAIPSETKSTGSKGDSVTSSHEILSNRMKKKMKQQARLLEQAKHQTNEAFFTHAMTMHRIDHIWTDGQILSLTIRDCRALRFVNSESYLNTTTTVARTSPALPTSVAEGDGCNGKRSMSHASLKHKRKFENMKCRLVPWPSATQIASSSLFTAEGRVQASSSYSNDFLAYSARHDTSVSTVPESLKSTKNSESISSKNDSNKIILNETGDEELIESIPILIIRKNTASSRLPGDESGLSRRNNRNQSKDVLPEGCTGWDIIVPEGWGPSVWKAIVFAGATAIGVSEYDRLQLLSAQPSFPRDYPDTPTGEQFWANQLSQKQERNKRRPRRKQLVDCTEYIPKWKNISKSFYFERHKTHKSTSSSRSVRVGENSNKHAPNSNFVSNSSSTADCEAECVSKVKSLFVAREASEIQSLLTSKSSTYVHGNTGNRPSNRNASFAATLTSAPSLSRTLATLITALIHMPGKGRCLDGAKIIIPTAADCEMWLHHRQTRLTVTLSRRLHGRKLCGDWVGVNLLTTQRLRKHRSEMESVEESRIVAGFVTSGQNDGGSRSGVSIGCADVNLLSHNIQQFHSIAKSMNVKERSTSTSRDTEQSTSAESSVWRSARLSLVLVHNPYSSWLRPALIEMIVP